MYRKNFRRTLSGTHLICAQIKLTNSFMCCVMWNSGFVYAEHSRVIYINLYASEINKQSVFTYICKRNAVVNVIKNGTRIAEKSLKNAASLSKCRAVLNMYDSCFKTTTSMQKYALLLSRTGHILHHTLLIGDKIWIKGMNATDATLVDVYVLSVSLSQPKVVLFRWLKTYWNI